jgi:DNA repair protein SbcD/Mre11
VSSVDSRPEPAITSAIPRPATILHTSDCHLDEVDDGTPQRAFAAAIDQSIELDVDLLLITGDLFDHNRVGDAILDWTVAQLDRADRPVVLMVGNHDTLDSASVHHRFEAGSRCRQVQFLDDPDGTTVEVPGTDIVVWGRAMVEHEPSFRPLQGHTPRIEGRWHVIAGHGLWVGTPMAGRSSPIFPEDIEALDADYVALGHLHAHQVVSEKPLALYPGATASSRQREAGCVVVELAPGRETAFRWVPLDVARSVAAPPG